MKNFLVLNQLTFLALLNLLILLHVGHSLHAQTKELIPDLSRARDTTYWSPFNRNATYRDEALYLDSKPGEGILWLKDLAFFNGIIELDIKGKNETGKSFVGVAFHGLDNSTYEAIYFRPFNFLSPLRKNHSVQYVSHPAFTWDKLREQSPGKYENETSPVPDPEQWFHAKVVVESPVVKVFVNHSKEASVTIKQLSTNKSGMIGLWVGNNSDGYFKNLRIVEK